MKKFIAIILIILGVAIVIIAIYFLIEPTISRSIGNLLAILGGILAGIFELLGQALRIGSNY